MNQITYTYKIGTASTSGQPEFAYSWGGPFIIQHTGQSALSTAYGVGGVSAYGLVTKTMATYGPTYQNPEPDSVQQSLAMQSTVSTASTVFNVVKVLAVLIVSYILLIFIVRKIRTLSSGTGSGKGLKW